MEEQAVRGEEGVEKRRVLEFFPVRMPHERAAANRDRLPPAAARMEQGRGNGGLGKYIGGDHRGQQGVELTRYVARQRETVTDAEEQLPRRHGRREPLEAVAPERVGLLMQGIPNSLRPDPRRIFGEGHLGVKQSALPVAEQAEHRRGRHRGVQEDVILDEEIGPAAPMAVAAFAGGEIAVHESVELVRAEWKPVVVVMGRGRTREHEINGRKPPLVQGVDRPAVAGEVMVEDHDQPAIRLRTGRFGRVLGRQCLEKLGGRLPAAGEPQEVADLLIVESLLHRRDESLVDKALTARRQARREFDGLLTEAECFGAVEQVFASMARRRAGNFPVVREAIGHADALELLAPAWSPGLPPLAALLDGLAALHAPDDPRRVLWAADLADHAAEAVLHGTPAAET